MKKIKCETNNNSINFNNINESNFNNKKNEEGKNKEIIQNKNGRQDNKIVDVMKFN